MSTSSAVDRGRTAYAARRWHDAFEELTQAEQDSGLSADDLQRLGTVALLMGRFEAGVGYLARAHEEYLLLGEVRPAIRCAAWLGIHLRDAGERAESSGWFARARRLMADLGEPIPEESLLIASKAVGALYNGDAAAALELFARAQTIAASGRDREVESLCQLGQGQAKIRLGSVEEGMELLDEALAAVMSGEAGAIVSGIIYCSVIESCGFAFDLARAQEWTAALDRWRASQGGLVAFSGQCHMHRAELFLLHGAWDEAEEATRRAQAMVAAGDRYALYGAFYQAGEVQRLRGHFDAAEESYQQARRTGWEPQPGWSLLMLAQGHAKQALALLRRTANDRDAADRRLLLPALVETGLAAGETETARNAADELALLSHERPTPWLQALAAYAAASILLHDGEIQEALERATAAWRLWCQLDSPYEAARCLVLKGLALHRLGEDDSAHLELAAARRTFEELGAAPALEQLSRLAPSSSGVPAVSGDAALSAEPTGPLSRREREVLALVASGKPNRAIAAELFLSEKTVARHVSNILLKLDVPSRTAAAAYAFEHGIAGRTAS